MLLQMHVLINSKGTTDRVIMNRRFNFCKILKSKTQFIKIREAAREISEGRLNYPLSCPFKKGTLEVLITPKIVNIFKLLGALEEIRRLFPSGVPMLWKNTFNATIAGYTSINSISVQITQVEFKNIKFHFPSDISEFAKIVSNEYTLINLLRALLNSTEIIKH